MTGFKPLLDINGLAEFLNVPVGRIYQETRKASSDVIPPWIRVGKYLRWHPQDVEDWLSAKRAKGVDHG